MRYQIKATYYDRARLVSAYHLYVAQFNRRNATVNVLVGAKSERQDFPTKEDAEDLINDLVSEFRGITWTIEMYNYSEHQQ